MFDKLYLKLVMGIRVSGSVLKSGHGTGKRPRPDRDRSGPQNNRTAKDHNRGPVYGPLQIKKIQDRSRPVFVPSNRYAT